MVAFDNLYYLYSQGSSDSIRKRKQGHLWYIARAAVRIPIPTRKRKQGRRQWRFRSAAGDGTDPISFCVSTIRCRIYRQDCLNFLSLFFHLLHVDHVDLSFAFARSSTPWRRRSLAGVLLAFLTHLLLSWQCHTLLRPRQQKVLAPSSIASSVSLVWN